MGLRRSGPKIQAHRALKIAPSPSLPLPTRIALPQGFLISTGLGLREVYNYLEIGISGGHLHLLFFAQEARKTLAQKRK